MAKTCAYCGGPCEAPASVDVGGRCGCCCQWEANRLAVALGVDTGPAMVWFLDGSEHDPRVLAAKTGA